MNKIEFEASGEEGKSFGYIISHYPKSIVFPASIEFGFWWVEIRIINYSMFIGWTDCWADIEEEEEDEE